MCAPTLTTHTHIHTCTHSSHALTHIHAHSHLHTHTFILEVLPGKCEFLLRVLNLITKYFKGFRTILLASESKPTGQASWKSWQLPGGKRLRRPRLWRMDSQKRAGLAMKVSKHRHRDRAIMIIGWNLQRNSKGVQSAKKSTLRVWADSEKERENSKKAALLT